MLNPKARIILVLEQLILLAAELLDVTAPHDDPVLLITVSNDPPLPVPVGRLLGGIPRVKVVGFAMADADGTLFFPEGITCILLELELNFVCARDTC